jgi:hypothetical protein
VRFMCWNLFLIYQQWAAVISSISCLFSVTISEQCVTLWCGILQSSVSQPPGRGPVPGPEINYTVPSFYKKIIYRAAVSQRLRTTTVEQSTFLYDTYVKYGSAGKCRWKFWRKFRDERVPSRQRIHSLVNKLRTTGLLINKKQKHMRWVLTKEKLDDIRARLEHTPRKLLKHLAQETGVSKPSAIKETQLLKLRPYKTTVIHASQPCIQLVGFVYAADFCSLSSNARSIYNWHSYLMKRNSLARIHKYAK